MRSVKLATLAVLAAALLAVPTIAHADAIPNGLYYLDARPGTGIHLSTGTLTGTVTYGGGVVTAADIVFTSVTNGTFIFDTPGPTTIGQIFSTPDLLETTITSSAHPNASYFLSVEFPSNADNSFTLTCGVDCDTEVDLGSPTFESEEFTGRIVPSPEPSSIILFATGALGLAQAIRCRVVKA